MQQEGSLAQIHSMQGSLLHPLPSPWSQQLWAGEPPSQPQELAQTVALKFTQSPSQSVEQQAASYSHTQSSQLTFACRTVTVAPHTGVEIAIVGMVPDTVNVWLNDAPEVSRGESNGS